MQLKTYQQNALEQLDHWLDALKKSLTESDKVDKELEGAGLPFLKKKTSLAPHGRA